MRRYIQTLTVAGIVALASFGAAPALAQQPSCQLGPVFQMLRDMVGRDRAGECNGSMVRNDAGDVTQPTTRGIMTLRAADQVAAFSDGQITWLLGPNGLESRASNSRLPWESASAASGGNGLGTTGQTGSPATPTPVTATPAPYGATPPPTQYGVPGLAYNQSSSNANQSGNNQPQTTSTQTPTTSAQYQGASQYQGSSQYQDPNSQYPSSTSNGQNQNGNGQAPATYGQVPNGRVGANQLQSQPGGFPPQPSPTPLLLVQDELPMSFDGSSGSTSKPFDLTGGSYVVAWQASQRNKDACYVGARLRHVEDQNPGNLVMHTTLGSTKDRSSSGETRLTNVAPGRYVLDVMTTGCSWKMTLRLP